MFWKFLLGASGCCHRLCCPKSSAQVTPPVKLLLSVPFSILPTHPRAMSIPCFPRNPRLLLLHPADKAGPGHGAFAELLLGPDSGELPSLFGVTLEGEDRAAPHKPLPTPGASRTFFVGGVFPVAGAMSPLLVAAGAAPTCAAHFGLRPAVAEAFCPHSGCSEQSCPVHFSSFPWGMWDSALSSSSCCSWPGLQALCRPRHQCTVSLPDGDRGLLPHCPRVLQRVRHVRGHPLPLLL